MGNKLDERKYQKGVVSYEKKDRRLSSLLQLVQDSDMNLRGFFSASDYQIDHCEQRAACRGFGHDCAHTIIPRRGTEHKLGE